MNNRSFVIFFFTLLLLVSVHAHSLSSSTQLQLMVVPDHDPTVNVTDGMFIFLVNDSTGSPVNGLEVTHEREMHVFIVSEDLQYFGHIHPEDFPDGMDRAKQGYYRVNYSFPTGGPFYIIAGTSKNGQAIIKMYQLFVKGDSQQHMIPLDLNKTKNFGNYTVTLQVGTPHVNELTNFSYHIMENGHDVTDLQMYLGAEMHVLLVDSLFTWADHLHPYIPGHNIHFGTMTQRYSGPTIPIQYNFTIPGQYVLFGQFQHDGEVVTTNFVLDVLPDDKPVAVRAKDELSDTRWLLWIIAGVIALILCLWLATRNK